MKKKWEKPKLIVLFRGKPEESVLGACKDGADIIFGPVNDNITCVQGTVACAQCNAILSS